MDEEETDRKKDEEELNRKKTLRILLIGLLLYAVLILFVFTFYDFFRTCTGWIIGGVGAAILYLIYYFFVRALKQKGMKYLFYIYVLVTIWLYVVNVLDACFPECP